MTGKKENSPRPPTSSQKAQAPLSDPSNHSRRRCGRRPRSRDRNERKGSAVGEKPSVSPVGRQKKRNVLDAGRRAVESALDQTAEQPGAGSEGKRKRITLWGARRKAGAIWRKKKRTSCVFVELIQRRRLDDEITATGGRGVDHDAWREGRKAPLCFLTTREKREKRERTSPRRAVKSRHCD